MRLVSLKLVAIVALSFLPALLIFSGFIKTTQAITPTVSLLCVGTSDGKVSWPASSGSCATGTNAVIPTDLPITFQALCLVDKVNSSGGSTTGILNAVDTVGNVSCSQYTAPTYKSVVLINRSQISGPTPQNIPPATTTTPPIIPTPTTKPVTTKPPTTSPTSTVNNTGSCPDGFTAKGPLCIPNNPFGSSDGIAGKGTVGELASTIISILLSISGIIAVIMVIIGGYQYMTARGNEEQAKSSRKTLTNALIGLAIIIVSYAVVQALTNYLITNK